MKYMSLFFFYNKHGGKNANQDHVTNIMTHSGNEWGRFLLRRRFKINLLRKQEKQAHLM